MHGKQGKYFDPKWGRALRQNQISIDQVPCNLTEGDPRTYEDINTKRVWLVGTKADDSKRFCTLQVAARASNGDPSRPQNGQPKLTIIFRGKGIRISEKERQGWHRDVDIRFQPKAWADQLFCENYAKEQIKEMTVEARFNRQETFVVLDNLHGQTTEVFNKECSKGGATQHLLPSGVTDEIQLVDGGIGSALKMEMGNRLDD